MFGGGGAVGTRSNVLGSHVAVAETGTLRRESMKLFKSRIFVVLIACEHERSANAVRGYKALEKRGRELHALAGSTHADCMANSSTIVLEKLIRRDAQFEFVAMHGGTLRARKLQPFSFRLISNGTPWRSTRRCFFSTKGKTRTIAIAQQPTLFLGRPLARHSRSNH